MTEKLYFKDSYICSCESEVLNITKIKDGILVELDKTVFFPTGGGQPYDKGTINDIEVIDVSEADGRIYHKLLSVDFSVGDKVFCIINKELRFLRMQSHTGEHIFSGVAHKMFDVENVGFHMDENHIMTVDFDKPLTSEEIFEIEKQANEFVYSDHKINTYIFSTEQSLDFEYRSKLELTEDIRIVEIENVDKCACCAPHLSSTGQVGIIKVLSAVSHRGGVRITLVCGKAAFTDYIQCYNQIADISTTLCLKHNEAYDGVKRLIEANSRLKYELEQMKVDHLKYIASSISPSDVVLMFFDSFSADELRILSNFIKENGSSVVILLSGNDVKGYSYCINSDSIDLVSFKGAFNNALQGSGGGKGSLVQGKLKATKDIVQKFIDDTEVMRFANA